MHRDTRKVIQDIFVIILGAGLILGLMYKITAI